MKKWIKKLYIVLALLSFLFVFWTALEMFGLTLRNPQMLFFSIIHTSPNLASAVVFSGLFFISWLICNLVASLNKSFRESIKFPIKRILITLTYQILHLLALFSYEFWAFHSSMRIIICVIGILSCLLILLMTIFQIIANFINEG